MNSFFKGAGIGILAGVTVGMMIPNKTKRRMIKSDAGRVIRSIGDAVTDAVGR